MEEIINGHKWPKFYFSRILIDFHFVINLHVRVEKRDSPQEQRAISKSDADPKVILPFS